MAKVLFWVMLAACFPVFWALGLSSAAMTGAGDGEGPAWWMVAALQAGASAWMPAVAIGVVWAARRWRVVAFKWMGVWVVLWGVLAVAAVVHTGLWMAGRISPSRLLDTERSPDGRWVARMTVRSWLDASYSLRVEEGRVPLRCRWVRQSMEVRVPVGEAEVRWSADGRYVTGWRGGVPVCGLDVVKGEEVVLERDLLLFVPGTAEERSALFDRLMELGGSPVAWLGSAVPAGREELRLEVLGKIQDVNEPSARGAVELPLHVAIRAGDVGLVRAVLDRGADCNRRMPGQKPAWTPLMLAAMFEQVEVVRLLLERGAEARVRDEWGKTAADYARGASREEIVRLLGGAGMRTVQ